MANPKYTKTSVRLFNDVYDSDYYQYPRNLLPSRHNNWVPDGYNYDLDSGYYQIKMHYVIGLADDYAGEVVLGYVEGDPVVYPASQAVARVTYTFPDNIMLVKKEIVEEWLANHKGFSSVSVFVRKPYGATPRFGMEVFGRHQMPTVTTSVTEANPVLGSTNNLVLPVSKKDVQVSANYSWSDITGVSVSVSTANTTYTQAPSPTLARTLRLDTTSINQGALNGISDPKINVDIHDSRGRTSRFELSLPYYRYIPPEVISFEASRDKDVATEIYAKSVVDLVSIPGYSVSLEYSINDSPYSMADFVSTERGFLTSLPLGEAFAIKLRLTDNYGFSKIYTDLAVSHSDIMEIYHDRIVFKVPVYDKEGNRIF